MTHTHTMACLYDVTIDVTDDDAGMSPQATVSVIVVGDETKIDSGSKWSSTYKKLSKDIEKGKERKDKDPSEVELGCLRDIAGNMSSILGEQAAFATHADVVEALSGKADGSVEKYRAKLLKEIGAAWLNYATGSTGLDGVGMIDGDYASILYAAEALWTDPSASKDLLKDTAKIVKEAQKDFETDKD